MEELENTIPTPGIEPGVPSNFEGSSISGSLQPGFNQIVPYDPTLTTPGIPGGVEIQYDPNNPFDVAKQVKASPITEGDIAFQRSKGKFFQPGFEKSNFERYYDDEDNFYKLGFDPNINNEQIYNQNRSWYEDVFRSAAAVPALGISVVKSSYRSLGDMLSGDFSMTDETGAREFSQIMAESGSTRGGVSGFASNLILQSGFIAGIAADYLATEALLAGAVALSEGAALPAAVAAGTAKTAQTVRSISALFDANTARQAYNTIKAIDAAKVAQGALNLTKSAAEALIPKTLVNIKGILTAESPVIGLANTVRGVGDFVLDMKQISYATSESALEGGQVKNDFIDRHINEYIENNGKYPDQTELDRIYQLASDAGTTTGLINAPLILLTNAVTFDNLFKGGKKNLITGSDAAILEEAKLSGKVTRFVERTGKFETMTAKDAFVESIRGLKSPKTYASFAKSYFSKNLTEGLQELSQEIIAGASEDYYDRIYDTPEAGGIVSYLADAYENLKNQASAQGAEVFLSGFLMGGLAGIATGAARGGFNTLKRNYLSARNPEEYKKAVQEEDERINKIASELNDAIQNGNKIFSEPDLENLLVQVKLGEDMVKARKSFDEKVFHDLKDMSRFNSVYTALQTNKFDFVIKKIEDMKQMTGAELKQAFGLADSVTDEEARKVLDVTIDRAYQVKEQYEQFSGYKNPFNPNKYFPNTPEGITQKIQELINFKGFEEAKKTAVFSLHGLEQAKKRMSDLTKSYATIASVAELNYSDVAATLSMDSIDNEINLLNAEIEMSKDTTDPTLTKTINNKKKKLKALESLKKNLERVKDVTDPTEVRKTTYLKKAFTDYMTVLTEEKGTFLTPKDINEAYRIFTDYYALNKDKADFTNLLSSLYDPENFANLVQREASLVEYRNRNLQKYFTRAFKKYSETSKIGLFLKELSNIGFVIDLKYLKELDDSTFENLKQSILEDADIKFRDLNSNKLFGTDDARYNSIVEFIKNFEIKTTPTPSETEAPVDKEIKDSDSESFVDALETFENIDPYFNAVLNNLFELENADRKNRKVAELNYAEFVLYPSAQNSLKAFTELQALYETTKKDNETVEAWLENSIKTNPAVYDILSKYGIRTGDIVSITGASTKFINESLKEGFKLETPQELNGLFIISGELPGAEGIRYFVTDNRSNLVSNQVYTTLEDAVKSREELSKKYQKRGEGFVFDGKYFYTGQTVSDDRGNTFTVLSTPSEIKQAYAESKRPAIKLKTADGREVPRLSAKGLFPGKYQAKRNEVAYIKDINRYKSVYAYRSQEDYKKAAELGVDVEEVANARLQEFLLNTPAEDIKNNLTIKIKNNKLTRKDFRGSYLTINGKKNTNVLERKERISIQILYKDQPIGFLRTLQQVQFYNGSEVINYSEVTPEIFSRIFDVNLSNYMDSYKNFKSAMRSSYKLNQKAFELLGEEDEVTLSNEEVLNNFGIPVIGKGSYDFVKSIEDRIPVSELDYSTIEGGYYIIDRNFTYKNGILVTGQIIKTNLTGAALERAEVRIEEALKTSGTDGLNRYLLAVELPNGTIRFVSLTPSQLSSEEMGSIIQDMNTLAKAAREDNTTNDPNYTDIENKEKIYDKLFLANAPGIYSRLFIDSEGYLIGEFSDNNSFNTSSNTDTFIRYDLASSPINSFEDLLNILNDSIKNGAILTAKKYKSVVFKPSNFRKSIPESASINDIINSSQANTGAGVIDRVSFTFNPIYKDTPSGNAEYSDLQTSEGASEFLEKIKAQAAAKKEAEKNKDNKDGKAVVNDVTETIIPKEPVKEKEVSNNITAFRQYEEKKAGLPRFKKDLSNKLQEERNIGPAEASREIEKLPEYTEYLEELENLRQAALNNNGGTPNRVSFKLLKDSDYELEDIEKLDNFIDWVKKNLPDILTVEDLENLQDNLVKNNKTVGAFIMYLDGIAGAVPQVKGRINVGARTPFKYHEAFHGVFRLLLNDKQITRYLNTAKKELAEQFKSGKITWEYLKEDNIDNLEDALEKLRLSHPLYLAMNKQQLQDTLYEEYLADMFNKWILNRSVNTADENKSYFSKLLNLIISFFKNIFQRNNYENLFKNIDLGKYANAVAQENRFSRSFEGGNPNVEALKTIKIGTELKELPTGRVVEVNKYLAGDRATRILASVAASFHKLREKAENKDVSDNKLYERIFDAYMDFYDYDNDYYRSQENYFEIENDLIDLYETFSGEENQKQLKEGAKEYLRVLSYAEKQEEDEIETQENVEGGSSTEKRKESYTIGGFGSLSTFVRTYIATTSFQDTSEFGRPIEDGSLVYNVVDSAKVYNGLLSSLSGITSDFEAVQRMDFFRQNGSTDTAKFIDRLFKEHNIDPTAPKDQMFKNITNPEQFLAVRKAFEKFKINYKFIGFDPKSRIVRVIDANSKDNTDAQLKYWESEYQKMYDANPTIVKKDGPSILNKLISVIKGEEIADANELSIEIQNTIGIDIQPLYIQLSIIHNKEEKTDEEVALLNSFKDVEPIDVEDLVQIAKIISSGTNPFYRKPLVNEEETDEEEQSDKKVDQTIEGAVARIKRIAKYNVLFDETMGATSWINADGERVWGYQSPTYNHKKTRSLRGLADPVKLGEAMEDIFMKNNYLLSLDAFQSMLPDLSLDRVDGTRIETLFYKDGKVGNYNRIIDRGVEGTTAGKFSPAQYIFANLALYAAGKEFEYVRKNGTKGKASTSTINIGVIEASNTIDLIDLPVIQAVRISGNNSIEITTQVYDAIKQMFKGEYERIAKVQQEINDDTIAKKDGYHTKFKGNKERGLVFIRTASILGSFKEDIEEAAKNGEDFNTVFKELPFKKLVTDYYNSYYDRLIEIFKNEDMLQFKDKDIIFTGKNVAGGMPAFITEGFKLNSTDPDEDLNQRKNIIKYTDKKNDDTSSLSKQLVFRHNIMQILINHHINSTFFNYMLNGDPARYIQAKSLTVSGIAIEEYKRLKGNNANGVSAYTEIIAPSLGINHGTTEMDVLTFADPTFNGTYSGSSGDLADAQMYITIKSLRHMLFGFGKLTERQAEFLNKIQNGEDVSVEDVFGENGSIKYKGQLNSLKIVYYNNGDNKAGYIKTSAFVLTKQFTSTKESNYTKPFPGREQLHKLRLELERKEGSTGLAGAVPVSASKGERKNVASSLDQVDDLNYSKIDMRYLTLQQENPSNKNEITDPTQPKQIIETEIPDNELINFRGVFIEAGKLKRLYETATANRIDIKYLERKNKTFTFTEVINAIDKNKKERVTTADLADFANYARTILINTGATNQEIDLFSLDENNNLKYDLNNSIVEKKFIQLYFTYFTKGVMQEKVPGHSLTLVSSFGYNRVKVYTGQVDELGIPIGEVVRDYEIESNPKKYQNLVTFNEEEGIGNLKKGDLYIDRLRHNVPVYNKDGKVVERYSEVVMPAHSKEAYQYLKTGKIPDVVAKAFGVRIPAQDRHSNYGIRIVDFAPVYYGSIVIASQELVEISGADFDVDKLYTSIKDYYYSKKKGFIEYGSGKTSKERFEQFVKYLFKNSIDFRVAYAAAKEGDKKQEKEITAEDLIALKKRFEEGISEEEVEEIKTNYIEDALKTLNLPSNPAEYEKAYIKNNKQDIYVGALNNIIFDAKYSLSFNDYTSKPSDEFRFADKKTIKDAPRAFQVAHVKPLTDILNEIKGIITELVNTTYSEKTEEERTELLKQALSTFEEAGYDSTTLVGMYYGWKNNKEGSFNIGAAVKGNLSWAFLQKSGYKAPFDIFEIDGKGYNDYSSELGEDGQRKAYIISALISAMTDNAKERLAAVLGLNIISLNYATHLVAVGVPLETAVIFINQPVIKQYFKLKHLNSLEFKRTAKYVSDENLIAQAAGYEDIEKFKEAFVEANKPKLKLQKLKNNFISEDKLDKLAVANAFLNLSRTTPYFNNVASITGLVKGFAPFIDSFEEIEESYATLISSGKYNIFYDADNEINYFDILLDKSPLYKKLLSIYFDIKSNLPLVFKRETTPFKDIRKAIVDNASIRLRGSFKKFFTETVDEDILSYLDILAYQRYLTKQGNLDYLQSLNNSIIYKTEGNQTIVEKVNAKRKDNFDKGKQNYFLDKFIYTVASDDVQTEGDIEYLQANSWSKLSSSAVQRLQSSFTELYNDDPTLAVELFHYLLVKDGGRYRSGSFLNIMPLFIMDDFFMATKNSMEALLKYDTDLFYDAFGADLQQIIDDITFNYFASANISVKGQGVSYIVNNFNPYTSNKEEEVEEKETKTVNRVVKISEDKSKIEIDVFAGIGISVKKGEPFIFKTRKGEEVVLEANSDKELKTIYDSKNETHKTILSENIFFLKKNGFVFDEIYYTGAPSYIYFNGGIYRLTSYTGAKKESTKGMLNLNASFFRAYGNKFVYQKVNSFGSSKATRLGFMFDGMLPESKEVEGNEKSKGENPDGSLASDYLANLKKSAEEKKQNSKNTQPNNNIKDKLAELGITRVPGRFTYIDETTGETLTQYDNKTPQEVLDIVSRNINEETENPFVDTAIDNSNKPLLNTLPNKSSDPTMTYAGIGSRETPSEVLKQMTEIAKELESRGYTLNTGITFGGKKEGADKAFSDGATKKNLFSPEKQGSRKKEQAIAKEIHPKPEALSEGGLKLMARNTNQIFGDDLDTPVDFVLFYAKEDISNPLRPQGGTGQAVEIARRKGIPTINMADTNWRNQLEDAIKGIKVQTSMGVSSTPTTKPAVSDDFPEDLVNLYNQQSDEFKTKRSLEKFVRSFKLLRSQGIKDQDILKHLCK